MALGLHEDDFLIYIADTQSRAIDLVPMIVRENFALSGGNTIRSKDGKTIVGIVTTWRAVAAQGLSGIHGRIHVWVSGHPTEYERGQVKNVASHWLSHVEGL